MHAPTFSYSDSPKAKLPRAHKRTLFLPAFLKDEAGRFASMQKQDYEHALAVLEKWGALEADGALHRKETAMDADFLSEVFGDALGYRRFTEDSASWQLERQFTVPGAGTADGALGEFVHGETTTPVAIVELKDAATDLDLDRFNGRTAVQQCWDYLHPARRRRQFGALDDMRSPNRPFVAVLLARIAEQLRL